MYVHSVKLNNFKSIGDYPESEVILEPRVTAIIGKNESGKSNVLEGLSLIDFRKQNSSAFAQNIINRNGGMGTQNEYIITLKATTAEAELGIHEDTNVLISKDGCVVTGGFLSYYSRTVYGVFLKLFVVIGQSKTNPFRMSEEELWKYRKYRESIEDKEKLDLYQPAAFIKLCSSKIGNLDVERKQQVKELLDVARDRWNQALEIFPRFFYRRSSKHLDTSYKYEEIEKELKNPNTNPNSLLCDFLRLIDVSDEDFLYAARPGSRGPQLTAQRKINRKISEKINKKFCAFYQTEDIALEVDFNGGVISFVVQSGDGEALMLSERSNGLKWYLETFIDAQANQIPGKNVVYLFDEPGTSLHVNAQRELLKLFNHLADQGNQVVYTTHSPYMLDLESNGVHRIRAVVKSSEGFTHIYKTAYDARIAPESQQDTLAPIVNALGMNLNDTFGPAKDKINVVTEGMSDYIYLSMMAKVLNVDTDRYAILPSVGASNCVNICSILHGWGCRYIALFDYDRAGVESGGEVMRNDFMLELNKQYCYLKEISQDDLREKTYKTEPYMIEDLVTQGEIERYCTECSISKTLSKSLVAKLISNAVENGSFHLCEACQDNFRKLFSRIDEYCADLE